MIEHGGNVRDAAKRYGIPSHEWLDLSTGISPLPYPAGTVEASAWHRLPTETNEFLGAAAHYYGSDRFLPVAGSQAVIQLLPELLGAREVALVQPSYGEHIRAWQAHGASVRVVDEGNIEAEGATCDAVVICNPNNPTGTLRSGDGLRNLRRALAARGGWLVVDEAFIDTRPGDSLVRDAGEPGLVVLRSLGKFFGLAGARVGFLFASEDVLRRSRASLGPWTIAGPSIEVATRALGDSNFHARATTYLKQASLRMQSLLRRLGCDVKGATDFFVWTAVAEARAMQDRFARKGILVRAFDAPASLRFGLPGPEPAWQRLEKALETI